MNIFGTSWDYQSRLEKVRKMMDERGVDAILVHLWPNQHYLSGMYPHLPWYPVEVVPHTETPLVIFRDRAKEPVVLTTYLSGIGQKEGTWIKDVRMLDKEPYGKMSWVKYLAELLKEKGVQEGTIGIEEDVLVLSTFKHIQAVLPKAKFKAIDEIFQLVRMVKEPEEIELIKQSVYIAEAGLKAGMEVAKEGVLESEVQKAAEIEMKRLGAIREVETMVQSGIRTANHRSFGANWKKIEKNDLVMIDIGCVYKAYGSDITRTWCVGKPTDSQKKNLDDILRIREKAIKLMKPGVKTGEIDDFGLDEMKKAGYITEAAALPSNGKGLGYVTVHGIGLGPMHDPPHPPDRDVELQSGMALAFTVGVRYAEYTLRYEDDLVIVPGGYELLNKGLPWKL